jgi:endonuclease-3
MSSFLSQLDALEAYHGPQTPCWPVDPYEFLIWWHCGYPASDATCTKGWAALQERIGVSPEQILKAKQATLRLALKAGGLIPELRTERVRLIASAVVREFNGDLARAFRQMQPGEIRRALKRLPGIADPGADRIMLFAGVRATAAVPSNATQVAVRMQFGPTLNSYTKDYLQGQKLIETALPSSFAARRRAFLLLKIHGQSLCKRSRPDCGACPIAATCAFCRLGIVRSVT